MPNFLDCCNEQSIVNLVKVALTIDPDWKPFRDEYKDITIETKPESLEEIDHIMRQPPRRVHEIEE